MALGKKNSAGEGETPFCGPRKGGEEKKREDA